jgi:acyl carrier protein
MKYKKVINDILLEVLKEKVTIDLLTPEKLLTDDLGADSMQLLEIALTLSTELDINVPREEVVDLRSIQDIYSFVAKHKGLKSLD